MVEKTQNFEPPQIAQADVRRCAAEHEVAGSTLDRDLRISLQDPLMLKINLEPSTVAYFVAHCASFGTLNRVISLFKMLHDFSKKLFRLLKTFATVLAAQTKRRMLQRLPKY